MNNGHRGFHTSALIFRLIQTRVLLSFFGKCHGFKQKKRCNSANNDDDRNDDNSRCGAVVELVLCHCVRTAASAGAPVSAPQTPPQRICSGKRA